MYARFFAPLIAVIGIVSFINHRRYVTRRNREELWKRCCDDLKDLYGWISENGGYGCVNYFETQVRLHTAIGSLMLYASKYGSVEAERQASRLITYTTDRNLTAAC